MKKSVLLFFLVPFLSSCVTSGKDFVQEIFGNKETREVEMLSFEVDSIRNPYMMEFANNHLFFVDLYQSTFIRVFDWNTRKYKADFARRGVGPDEFLYFTQIASLNNKLYLWDTNKETVYSTDLTNNDFCNPVYSAIHIPSDSTLLGAFKVLPINDDFFVATGLIKKHRMALVDKEGKVVKTFGDYPKERKDKNYTDIENGFAYQSFMAYQDQKQVLSVGSMNGESIAFYDMSNIASPKLIKEFIRSFPQYKDVSTTDSQSVVFQRDNIDGFIEIKPSSKYCIALFSGVPRTEEDNYGGNLILLFDWDGNPVKAIELSQRYTNMAFNESKRELILLGKDPVTFDFRLFKMDLSTEYNK